MYLFLPFHGTKKNNLFFIPQLTFNWSFYRESEWEWSSRYDLMSCWETFKSSNTEYTIELPDGSKFSFSRIQSGIKWLLFSLMFQYNNVVSVRCNIPKKSMYIWENRPLHCSQTLLRHTQKIRTAITVTQQANSTPSTGTTGFSSDSGV